MRARATRDFRRDFRGDVKFRAGIFAQDFAEQLFAVAIAVNPSRIEEIAAKIDGTLERSERFGVVGAGPRAHAPHAIPDVADLPSGAAETAIVHGYWLHAVGLRSQRCARNC